MNKTIETVYSDHIKRGAEWIEIARQYYEVQMQLKALSAQDKVLKAKIKELSDNKNAIGGGFRWTSIERNGLVNYKLIPELKEVDLDEYRGEGSQSWQLRKV